MFRDRIRYPVISDIRRRHDDTTDVELIRSEFKKVLGRTRFLGIGNPSESGTHLLYLFRQANRLDKELFIHTHEVFDWTQSRPTVLDEIDRLVFIDDLAGSGTQAIRYSRGFVKQVKAQKPNLHIAYHMLFATTKALAQIRRTTQFDQVDAVCELDDSFRCVADESRYFPANVEGVTLEAAREMARRYGQQLAGKATALGFKNGQLLLGFAHNIPNNTLPILWHRGHSNRRWSPLFERHDKILNT